VNSELEVIDGFVDGQRVDASALKNALATAEGRDYLVDAWLLREALQSDGTVAGAAPNAIVPRQSLRRSSRSWLVAAAVSGSLISGYALGHLTPRETAIAPPQPTTSIETRPVSAFPVPAPTRVIQVEFQTADGNRGGD